MFKNNDLRPFFAQNEKFDDQSIKGKFEKFDFHHYDYLKNHSYSKCYADFNAKKRF